MNEILAREVDLPITLEHHYKFVVLLPLEADEKIEALKHYFGITQSNELIARNRDKMTRRTKFHQRISDRIALYTI